MKKIITILFVVFICTTTSSFAQRFGVKGGFNITNLNVEGHDYSAKLGIHIGPVAEFHFGDIFGLETGVLLSTKGAKEKFGDDTYKINLTYLDFPVNFRAGYDFGTTRVYGILGPYFGFALGGKYKNEINDVKTSTKIEFGDGGLSRFDAGLTIGACAAVSIFELGFSYNHGFVDISGDSGHKMKNRVFMLSMAYKFGENPFRK
ncbi:MAG: PorT family protein [Bacteroidales bacterium]|nr:PorT family protein [Bacteroidales bacterium]